MSVLIAVRVPEDIAAKIEASGKSKSEVVIKALEEHLHIVKSESEGDAKRAKPGLIAYPRCESPAAVIRWGAKQHRCTKCAMNFPTP